MPHTRQRQYDEGVALATLAVILAEPHTGQCDGSPGVSAALDRTLDIVTS
jgi:hypothetical protein